MLPDVDRGVQGAVCKVWRASGPGRLVPWQVCYLRLLCRSAFGQLAVHHLVRQSLAQLLLLYLIQGASELGMCE